MIKEEIKDIPSFKLTIAKEETRIKVPVKSSPEERAEMLRFFAEIRDKVGIPEHTLRGVYNSETKSIRIRGGHIKKQSHTFFNTK